MRTYSRPPSWPTRLSGQPTRIWPGWQAKLELHIDLVSSKSTVQLPRPYSLAIASLITTGAGAPSAVERTPTLVAQASQPWKLKNGHSVRQLDSAVSNFLTLRYS